MKKVLFIGVTNFDFKKGKDISHLESKYEALSKKMKVIILGRGRPFHYKTWNSEFYLLPSRFLFWLLGFFVAFYLCLVKKVDTIITQSPLIEGFIASILKKIFKKELIIEVHGDWELAPFLSKKRKFMSFQKKFTPILARFSFQNADKIRVISNYLREKVQKIAPQKSYFVFPTFTDINLFLEEKDIKYNNFILFVGALEEVKGVEYLIEAFAKINSEFPEFKLIIIGDGSQKDKLKILSSNLGLKNEVEFKGKLSLKETKNIMKDCYFLVLPSLSEGLGRVLMEAMALKKAVVGSNVGGIPDLIKDNHNGFLTEPKNINDLSQKLETLLNDRNLTIKMGERGKEIVEKNFSNERYIEKYIQMIDA